MKPETESEIAAAFARAGDGPPARGRAVEIPMGPDDVGPMARAERLHREQRHVIAPAFVPVVRASELATPGAFAAVDLAGVPVAVVRQPGGDLAAFVNVCAHRGAQVLRCERGSIDGATVTCPYHNIAYGLDGRLASCPVPASFPEGFEPGRAGMEPLPVGEALGWIWVRPAGGDAEVNDWLGPDLLSELDNYPLHRCVPVDSRAIPCAFDWKIGVEAFLEPLHVPAIHARSAHPMVDFQGMATRPLGKHSRMALPFRLDRAFERDGFLGEAAHAAGIDCFARLNAVQRRAHLVYLIYPYTVLMLFPNHLLALRFEPTDVGQCTLHYDLLAEPPATEPAATWLDSLRPGYDRLIEEDLDNLSWIERGLASGRATTEPLSSFERRIEWFRDALQRG